MAKAIKTSEFGPVSALPNFSRLGYRYLRILTRVDEEYIPMLTKEISQYPSVNWIVRASGSWNFGIGILAQDNREAFDVQRSIKRAINKFGLIVSVGEAVNAWLFPNHPQVHDDEKRQFIEPYILEEKLSILEWDYLKIVALDYSLPTKDIAEILNIAPKQVEEINKSLKERGIIVEQQKRINFKGNYYKVYIDSSSAKNYDTLLKFRQKLFKNPRLIYVVDSIGKYDFEIEIYANNAQEVRELLEDFSSYEVVSSFKYLYQMPFPIAKTANLLDLKETFISQHGKPVIDLLNSKLWYLNTGAVEYYLKLDEVEDYAKSLKTSENELIKQATTFYRAAEYYNSIDDKPYVNVIDWGAGSGKVGKAFVEELGTDRIRNYYPLDIQPVELMKAADTHRDAPYNVKPVILDFEKIESRFPLALSFDESELHIFFGSTYGNFDIPVINGHMKKVVKGNHNKMIVHVAVYDVKNNAKEIIKSYASKNVANFISGQLTQVGFDETDFVENKDYPGIIIHPVIEKDCLVIQMKLKRDVVAFDKIFKAGTVFKVSSSRKMTAEAFKKAMERDFNLDFFASDEASAIAVISEKK